MAGDESAANWIVSKLKDDGQFRLASSIGSGFLEIARNDGEMFSAVAVSSKAVVAQADVAPVFEVGAPEFVVNVPSKAIWSGNAIDLIHHSGAAFGTFGELIKASGEGRVSSYRNKEYSFFETAFSQHSAVTGITRIFDRVFQLHRKRGMADIVVALVEAYDMSAEDIRNARNLYGHFDAALKISSYGSIASSAITAAESMGANAFKFGEFLGRLNKP